MDGLYFTSALAAKRATIILFTPVKINLLYFKKSSKPFYTREFTKTQLLPFNFWQNFSIADTHEAHVMPFICK